MLYIGIMSGTSADGLDLALVNFSDNNIELVASYYQAYTPALQQKITSLYLPSTNEIDRSQSLAIELSQHFAKAIKAFLAQQNLSAGDINAIGNHGQTVRHRPTNEFPFTLQIGCHQTLATLTGIHVIGDFRQKDMVYGGQGAPLVPAFHQALFPSELNDVFIVNIGGIANITYLPADKKKAIIGFDTGPGNALLDAWYQQHHSGSYDNQGAWANSGKVDNALLNELLNDSYFQQPLPKSTGREYFHLDWLKPAINNTLQPTSTPADIQTTLGELTAKTLTDAIKALADKGNVYLCGGGVYNQHLTQLITNKLPTFSVTAADSLAIDSQALEAMAFAWFAYAFEKNIPGNIPSVTGASKAVVLGVHFSP